jgi:hypothetical protein
MRETKKVFASKEVGLCSNQDSPDVKVTEKEGSLEARYIK